MAAIEYECALFGSVIFVHGGECWVDGHLEECLEASLARLFLGFSVAFLQLLEDGISSDCSMMFSSDCPTMP